MKSLIINIQGQVNKWLKFIPLPPEYVKNGDRFWFSRGILNRNDDFPAIERSNGDKEWWFLGKRHRTDGPAVEYSNGTKEWWADGVLHRSDGPAIIYSNGDREYWYLNQRHNNAGGPSIIYGKKQYWYRFGIFIGDVAGK